MEFAGLPLHPLIVHAAVVLTPIAAALSIVFAVVPKWRYLSRWPAVLTTVAAFGAVWLSRLSGTSLLSQKPELRQLVHTHQVRGQQLSLLMILFLVVVLVAAWALSGTSGLISGRGAREAPSPALDRVLPPVVVVASLLVLVWVVLTGDAGARALWG
jgi:uncharacterized membrane protein